MTVRSEGQFNTVVYEDYDLYRGIDRRDVVLVHPDDIARLGLSRISVSRFAVKLGQMADIILAPFSEIRPGNALMYYPEANVLVPRTVDPQSKTPAFKNVLITLIASTATAAREHQNGDTQTATALVSAAGDHNTRKSMRSC